MNEAFDYGYFCYLFGIYTNPYEHDAEAQAWEDGYSLAMRRDGKPLVAST